jgi:D-alanyl-D-alanine carboxypeptidase/D-alanyl-D-alanine-endopeptidase (penicillin-binding protein 4)
MVKTFLLFSLACLTLCSFSQARSFETLLSDSSMVHASVSLCIADAESGEVIKEYNSRESLIPASVMKLVTSAAALELLGPGYTFKTAIGYTGSLNKAIGTLTGNLIIKGGGDPALGSTYFTDHYQDFLSNWVNK